MFGCSREMRETLYIEVPSGVTFATKVQVLFEGQVVGAIEPKPVVNNTRYRITLTVPASSFSESDTFWIKQAGMLGDAYIDISRGDSKSKSLRSEKIVKALSTVNDFEKIPIVNIELFTEVASLVDSMKELSIENKKLIMKELRSLVAKRAKDLTPKSD